MAKLTFQKLASGYNLHSNHVHHWKWNNAHSGRVYSFTVNPYVISTQDYMTAKAEVIKTYQLVKLNPPERELHVLVKNTGSFTIHYDIFMSSVRP